MTTPATKTRNKEIDCQQIGAALYWLERVLLLLRQLPTSWPAWLADRARESPTMEKDLDRRRNRVLLTAVQHGLIVEGAIKLKTCRCCNELAKWLTLKLGDQFFGIRVDSIGIASIDDSFGKESQLEDDDRDEDEEVNSEDFAAANEALERFTGKFPHDEGAQIEFEGICLQQLRHADPADAARAFATLPNEKSGKMDRRLAVLDRQIPASDSGVSLTHEEYNKNWQEMSRIIANEPVTLSQQAFMRWLGYRLDEAAPYDGQQD
jgi:hypothetical protein